MDTFNAIICICVCMSIASIMCFSFLSSVVKRARQSIQYCLSEGAVEELAKLVRGHQTELSEEAVHQSEKEEWYVYAWLRCYQTIPCLRSLKGYSGSATY